MSRINTNIPSMVATRILRFQNRSLNQALTRLSTGLRINTGADDPAGLIASESLRGEKVAISAAIQNISRANNVVATAESGLDEINKLLLELEDLVTKSANEAGISDDERDANQLQIDAILESINRIASSAEFQGRKLLDGTLDYTTSNIATSALADVNVLAARIPNNGYLNVAIEVTQSAQLAYIDYSASATGAGTTTIEITGNLGTEVFSFASKTAIADVAEAINQSKDLTGVSAYVSGNLLRMTSTQYGSDQFVKINVLAGTFSTSKAEDFGQDAGVLVNGVAANVQGLNARVRSATVSLDLELTADLGTKVGGTTSFQVTGGGADFMISPTVSLTGLASLGITSVSTGKLGKSSTGFLSSLASGQANDLKSGNFAVAQRIIRAAQTQVAELRGRLGAFQKNTLETMANALRVTLENTTAAESSIRDADFAVETSNLTRAQILVQSATNVLRLANAQPQAVLALLG